MSLLTKKVAIGIDVGGTNLRAGLIDQSGQVLEFEKRPTPTLSRQAFLDELCQMIESLREKSKTPILGIGVGWPGPVNSRTGRIFETPNISDFNDFAMVDFLKEKIGLPIFLENDAKCAGLAERSFGNARSFKDFILLTFGTGIGGVIFTDGKILRGKSGLAGEIGHMTLVPKGEPCSCGNQGCFERYCSSIALERMTSRHLGIQISSREILLQANQNPDLSKILDEYTQYLAIAVGSLVNIFDPEAIVFSGGLFTTGGEVILQRLKSQIIEQGFHSLKSNLKLIPTGLDGKAGLVGAACLALAAEPA
jgi:glucokinase